MSDSNHIIRPCEVDKIMNKRIVGGKVYYLVKWSKYSYSNQMDMKTNTWELRENFSDPAIVEKFEREWLKSIPGQSQNARRTLPSLPEAKRPVVKNISNTNVVQKSPLRATIVGKTSQDSTLLEEMNTLMESELQCSICLDVYKKPSLTVCDHIFCDQCITSWLKKKNATCPICRSKLRRSQRKLTKMDSFIVKCSSYQKSLAFK